MWRESRCQPEVRSRTSDTGLLQVNDVNRPWLSDRFDTPVTVDMLRDPEFNVRASAKLYKFWVRATGNGYQPWRTR